MSVAYQSWEVVSGPAMGLNMSPQSNLCGGYLVGMTKLPDEANPSQDTVIQGMSALSICMPAQLEDESCSESSKFSSSCSLSSKYLDTNSTSTVSCEKSAMSHVQIDGAFQSGPQYVTHSMRGCPPAFSPEYDTPSLGVEEKSLVNSRNLGITQAMHRFSVTSTECQQIEDHCSARAGNSIFYRKLSSFEIPRDGSSFSSFCRGSKYTLGVVAEDKPWEDSSTMRRDGLELDTMSTSSKSLFSCSDDSPMPSSDGSCESGDGEVQSAYNGSTNVLGGTSSPRKGLSRFYTGKSRSFSCLGDVMSLKDLAKPKNPYTKRCKNTPGRSMNANSRAQLPPLQKGIASISKKPVHSGKSTLALAVAMSAREDAIVVVEHSENKAFVDEQKKWERGKLPSRSYSLSDLQGSERELSSFH